MNTTFAKQSLRTLSRWRITLFAFLLVPCGIIVMIQLRQPAAPQTRASDVSGILLAIENEWPLSQRDRQLWTAMQPSYVAFHRIGSSVEDRIKHRLGRMDKVYLDTQLAVIEALIADDQRMALHVLGYLCLESPEDSHQALALIMIREWFPRKYSVYFANHLVNKQEHLVSRIAASIISEAYMASSVSQKLEGRYLNSIATPVTTSAYP